jgi:hypothetical protein
MTDAAHLAEIVERDAQAGNLHGADSAVAHRRTLLAWYTEAVRERDKLRALALKGRAVVEDFMPNVGRCALQHYDTLNEFLCETAALAPAIPASAGATRT